MIVFALTFFGPGMHASSGLYLLQIFLVQRIAHRERWWFHFITFVGVWAGMFLAFFDTLTHPFNYLVLLLGGVFALLVYLPYVLDSFVRSRFVGGWVRLLALPLFATSIACLATYIPPLSLSWGDPGNVGDSFFNLSQIGSLFGMSGVTFFMTLVASLANFVIDEHKEAAMRRAGGVSALFRGARDGVELAHRRQLAMWTVTVAFALAVAYCTALPTISDMMHSHDTVRAVCILDGDMNMTEGFASSALRPDIILWSEISTFLYKGDEELIQKAQQVARDNQVLIGLAYEMELKSPPYEDKPYVNVLTVIKPDGTLGFKYWKAHPIPGVETETMAGNATIPYIDVTFRNNNATTRVGGIICYDMDFPAYLWQAGQAHIDIMLQPSWTWEPLSRMHQQLDAHRNIEQGFNTFRCTNRGVSAVVDTLGRTLAQYYDKDPNYLLADTNTRRIERAGPHTSLTSSSTLAAARRGTERVLIADMPRAGRLTLYSLWRDAFAWVCTLGGLFVFVAAILSFVAKIKRSRLWRVVFVPNEVDGSIPAFAVTDTASLSATERSMLLGVDSAI